VTAPAKLVHRYRPYGSAKDFFECRDHEVLLVGPAGTGKSRVAMEKLNLLALLNPGMRGIIIRKTLVSLGSTALVTWRKFVIPEAVLTGTISFYGGGPQESAGYRYDNGSFIAIGGMDKPAKVMSSEYDVVYVQEATDLDIDDWEALRSRLRNWVISFQQIIADCNPNVPWHWLKARADRGATTAIPSRHQDNPMLFDHVLGDWTPEGRIYVFDILGGLTGVRRMRLLDGLWAAAEGLIYENYNPANNLVNQLTYKGSDGVEHDGPPPEWPRYWSIDFGYTNPFVCQFWAEDPDGRLFLYREIYATRILAEDHARAILRLVTTCQREAIDPGHKCEVSAHNEDGCHRFLTWNEPRPHVIICDHDAEDRATLERHLGMSTVAAVKTKKAGIQAVDSRWRSAGDGKPRLFLCRDSLVRRDKDLEGRKLPCSTIEEVPGYVWAKTASGGEKEEPLDKDNHGMDACRYMVAYKDLALEPGIRALSNRPRRRVLQNAEPGWG
jgi:hypothetical protein